MEAFQCNSTATLVFLTFPELLTVWLVLIQWSMNLTCNILNMFPTTWPILCVTDLSLYIAEGIH